MRYRREIDGLRAVAILPVVAYHAGATVLPAGFLGVDVFFVISGYLITGLLLQDLGEGRHSMRAFYERRARRILPALLAVLCACIPFAWMLMLPKELEDFFASLFSVLTFLANFFFLSQIDYFSPDADLQPLLHTWSLSIEEQYYLLAPAILAFLWRRGKRITLAAACLLTLGSFVICLWATQENPARSFFFSGSRFWEIGIGSICAIVAHGRPFTPRPTLALAGLLLVLGSFLFLGPEWRLPGWATLFPVIGTASILLFADGSTLAGRILGQRLPVAIGLVSYSAYLIHQPLFAFVRMWWIFEPPATIMLALAALTFLLAFLSWRWVEQPFRRRPATGPRRSILLPGAAASTTLAAVAIAGYAGHLPAAPSTSAGIATLEQRLAVNFGLSRDCGTVTDALANCATAQTPDTLVWGDSYAMHLVDGLASGNRKLVQMTMSACTPLLGLSFTNDVYGPEWAMDCMAFNRAVTDWAIATPDVRTIFVSSAFAVLDKQGIRQDGTPTPGPVDIGRVEDLMRQTLLSLRQAGKDVILVSPTPTADFDVGNCIIRSQLYGSDPARCDFPFAEATNSQLFPLMDRLSDTATVVRLDSLICPSGLCAAQRDGVPLYRDAGHLSHEGSAIIAGQIALPPARQAAN